MEFMYLVFTRMPGERYHRRLRSLLLCLCDVFRALITSLVRTVSVSVSANSRRIKASPSTVSQGDSVFGFDRSVGRDQDTYKLKGTQRD